MTKATFKFNEVIIGVDTHKDNHVAFAINALGVHLGEHVIPATQSGYEQLLSWGKSFGKSISFGVEGTGSYGRGLTSFLQRQGMRVVEVSRPPRRAERRRAGKNDILDAEQAARQVLSGQARAIPKTADGAGEKIRLLKIARDTAVKAQTQALVALKAILVTAPEDLRSLLEPLPVCEMLATCASFPVESPDQPASAMRHSLRALARRWLHLHEEIEIHTGHLESLTREAAPQLVGAYGIGTDTAAEMLLAFGDNSNRIDSEAAFAKMCGVCPLPASSGRTQRHRLNRGGNRQANAALFRVVIVRMRWHEPTKAYVARRTAQGLSKREIIRCLKRYLAREIFQLLRKT